MRGSRSFVARLDGTLNTATGAVVMSGRVARGAYRGSWVEEQGQLVDPATARFEGTIDVFTTPGIREYPLPNPASQPLVIILGPDQNLWFTEFLGNRIGVMRRNGRLVAEYEIPTRDSRPDVLVAGPDGAI